ncbi:MAG: ABC transporter substrate-binding protein [Acidobacteriota bacterium]|jgi:iron complex transport system substrate-binding protein|nr:ABC transporter substrate-binding protein [Acidobacteriota bacterium]
MSRRVKTIVSGLPLAFLAAALMSAPLQAREITDMYGRKVTVPDKITRVYTISPSVMLMLYSIDPDLMVGIPRALQEEQKPFFKKSFQDLPALGGSSGEGLNLNQELLLKVKPDVLIVWGDDGSYNQKTAASFERLGIPVVAVEADSVEQYADTFDFLGKLLGREKRAGELSGYARKTLAEVKAAVAKIPASKRVTVYNTRTGGLTSACQESHHARMIPLAGGVNPVPCVSKVFTGMEKMNIEQVLLINPEVILTLDAAFAQDVYRDARWAGIRAVKSKRVYLAPRVPVNWFDGPPSHMGLLGLQWLTNRLYPQAYPKDIEKEAAAFVKLFFQIDVPREELRKIIGK